MRRGAVHRGLALYNILVRSRRWHQCTFTSFAGIFIFGFLSGIFWRLISLLFSEHTGLSDGRDMESDGSFESSMCTQELIARNFHEATTIRLTRIEQQVAALATSYTWARSFTGGAIFGCGLTVSTFGALSIIFCWSARVRNNSSTGG